MGETKAPKVTLSGLAAYLKERMNLSSGNGNGVKRSWSSLVFQFTQDTTFHGVRYITADTPYVSRRVLWTIGVVLATSIFFWFMSDRLIYLYSYPKAVDVEVIYTDSVDFPAVTICNQNVFRMSATHKLGLHDIVEESFRNLQFAPGGSNLGENHEESWQTGFQVYRNSWLSGLEDPLASYTDVSAQACRHVCLKQHGDSCCSVIYDRRSRKCYVTPLDMTSSEATLVAHLYVDYFHRKKCQVQKSASCRFEGALCSFVQDSSQPLTWKLVNEEERLDRKYPEFDHTEMSGRGTYLLAATKFNQPDNRAHVVSPYILSSRSTCVSFYYQVRGGTLNIRTKTHKNALTTVWSRSGAVAMTEWERGYQRLPHGYLRLVVEASTKKSSALLNIAIDDITIGECGEETYCKETSSGKGYSGSLAVSKSNRTCQRWDAVPTFLRSMIWRSQSLELTQHMVPQLENFCRNPDDDTRGPWCFTDLHTGHMEYCDIPPCECRDVEFTCDNGQCISRDQLCNGLNDCGDLSDELRACNFSKSLACTFDDNMLCGYMTDLDSRASWEHRGTGDEQLVVGVRTENVRVGDTATLVSPLTNLTSPACLSLDYYLSADATLDIYLQAGLVGLTVGYSIQGRQHVCSLHGEDGGGWNYTHIILPNETFSLILSATIRDTALTFIMVDNITVLDENCTEIIPLYVPTTLETLTTTEIEVFDNTTSNDTIQTTMMETTTMYDVTTIGVHNVTDEPEIPPNPIFLCPSTTKCGTCIESFADHNGCGFHFKLVYPLSRGLATRCQHVNGTSGLDLAGCMQFVIQQGANAFNYHIYKGQCYGKLCTEGDLRLTQNYGGFDVYQMHETKEEEGISCTFRDRCACGYMRTSSNTYDVWVRQPLYKDITEVPTNVSRSNENDTISEDKRRVLAPEPEPYDHFMTVTNTLGLRPREGDWNRLISPIQTVHNASCLNFQYFTRYVDIKIFTYRPNGREKILDILHDGQQKAWHTASIDLDPGQYGVIFEFVYAELWAPEYAGIDEVALNSGSCNDEALDGSFNCTFEPDDYCGYRDISPGPIKWLRSKNYKETSPGAYYLRTSDHLEGKSHTAVSSPYQLITNTSCLQFYYFLQGTGRQGELMNTLSVTLEQWDRSRETIWSVRSITDNTWHFSQADLSEGYYRLVFEINGDQVRGGIDDVIVLDGDCPAFNCSEEESACLSKFACIPLGLQCNGMPNCHLADDELCTGGENMTDDAQPPARSKTPGPPTRGPTEADLSEDVSKDVGVALNLTEIYMRAAHQGEDFIFSCKWEGVECSYTEFSKQVTDYGVCYTFNGQDRKRTTAKTGSRFGLSLTLNIEQYEYMSGPQSDAGIKVFLHTKDELPQVRDLGFAIPPGTHTLVGIRLNEAKNLPLPWGDCGTEPLKFYDNYVHSRCVRECETLQVTDVCGCRDAYMPGYTDDHPPICNLSMYFTCAIPTINSPHSTGKQCTCPKPCSQTVFEPSLSSASLSYLSVDYILRGDTQTLLSKYRGALEAKQRVDENIFIEDIRHMSGVGRHYRNLLRFANTYLGDLSTSSIAKMATASSTLVGLFHGDLENLLGDLPRYLLAYNKIYADTIQLLQIYLGDTKVCLKELEQVVSISITKNHPHRFLDSITKKCVRQADMMHETLAELINKQEKYGKPRTRSVREKKKIPRTLFVRRENCPAHMRQMSDVLEQTVLVLERISTAPPPPEDQSLGPFHKDHVTVLRSNIGVYMARFSDVKECIEEYVNMLVKVERWKESIVRSIKEGEQANILLGTKYNLTHEALILEEDERDVERLLQRYTKGKITKLTYLRHFKPDDQSSAVVSNIKTFVERIQSRLTDPLRVRIMTIRDELLEYYMEALRRASQLQNYLDENAFYDESAKMKIWRLPTPNMENPERFNDIGREHWKVWNRDVPISTFVHEHAEGHIREALHGFCDDLLKLLDNFEEQLVFNKQKLILAMYKIQHEYQKYIEKRDIGHRFVLDNFLAMDVYFAQLKHQTVTQIEAYQLTQFLGDVGGFMGLLLGGSVLTVFELIDLFVFNFAKKLVARRDEEERERERMERILRRARQAEDQDESDTSRPLSAISDTGGKLGFHAIQPAKYGMPNDAVLV